MAETRAQQLPGFYIAVTLDNAQNAQGVCTAHHVNVYRTKSCACDKNTLKSTTRFLAQELASAKASLDEQDGKLAAFKSHHIGELPDDEQTNLNLLTGLTSQLDASTQALVRAQQDKTFSESLLSQQVAAWQAAQTGHDPDTLEQQLSALQARLATLQSSYTDDYPDVISTKNDIAALQKKIADSGRQYQAPGEQRGPEKYLSSQPRSSSSELRSTTMI